MLAHLHTVRDVSRALPALVSGPDLKTPDSAELLDTYATALRKLYDDFRPVIDRAGHALSEAMKNHSPDEIADPDGEGASALEQSEDYFKHRRKELGRLRQAFVGLGAPPSHDVFDSLERLDNLYLWIVAAMQEVRWTLLVFDGLRDSADSPPRRAFASSTEWLASLNEE